MNLQFQDYIYSLKIDKYQNILSKKILTKNYTNVKQIQYVFLVITIIILKLGIFTNQPYQYTLDQQGAKKQFNNISIQMQPTARYSFNKQQVKQLAELIMFNYSKCFSQAKAQAPRSLQQAFLAIIANKNLEIRQLKQSLITQLNNQVEQSNVRNDSHLDHAQEQQIDQLSQANLKIFSRLIELKNKKTLQLLHMRNVYDQLLSMFNRQKKLLQDQKNKNKQLSQQIKKYQIQITKMRNEQAQKKKKYDLIKENCQSITKNVAANKQQGHFIRKILIENYFRIQKEFGFVVETVSNKFLQQIANLKYALIKNQHNLNRKAQQLQSSTSNFTSTIRFLVHQLSISAGFQKLQSESDRVWIQKYRMYASKRTQRRISQPGQPNVHQRPRPTRNDEFIKNYTEYLRNS